MCRISFAMTTDQIRNQTKFVTRRIGWWNLQPETQLQPIEKGMGLKKGEKQVFLGCPIEILVPRSEPLNAITQEDVILEGFPDWTPEEFVEFLVKKHRCKPDVIVNRIPFDYLVKNEHPF